MFLILFLLLFPSQAISDTYSDLQEQKQIAEDDLHNDPDAVVLRRLKQKADHLQSIKKELEAAQVAIDAQAKVIEDEEKRIWLAKVEEFETSHVKGVNWTSKELKKSGINWSEFPR